MKELMEYMAWHHEDLLKTMTEEQKEILEKIEDCRGEYANYAEEAIFEYAFKLGMNMAIESLNNNWTISTLLSGEMFDIILTRTIWT